MAIGAIAGGLAGALMGGGGGGSASGTNLYDTGNWDYQRQKLAQMMDIGMQGVSPTIGNDPTQEVLKNPILGQLYNDDSPLARALAEDKAMSTGKLTTDEMSEYGQMAGDIARQFDQGEASLANALAARGMDTSGAATMAFAGSQGNKREQLQKAQQKIIADKMNRVQQNRQLINQMGAQANQAVNSQFNRQAEGTQIANQAYKDKYNMAKGWLDGAQQQWNVGHQQQQQQAPQSGLASGLAGAVGGALSGARLENAMGGFGSLKDIFGGSKPQPQQNSAALMGYNDTNYTTRV